MPPKQPTTAIKVVGVILGLVAAVLLLPWLNQYIFFLLALIGAIAGGVIVYVLSVRLLTDLTS